MEKRNDRNIIEFYENFDLNQINTPLDVGQYARLLRDTHYDSEKTSFLVDGFTNGFDLRYSGPANRQDFSQNILSPQGWETFLKCGRKL